MFDQMKNLKGLAGLMGQAGQMQEKMAQMQEELARHTVVGDAGAGAVRVIMNGRLEVTRVELDRAMIATLAPGITPRTTPGITPGTVPGTVPGIAPGTAHEIVDGTTDEQTDQEMVEELIAAAFNDAMARAQELVRQEMSKITGGLDLSGMGNLPGLT